MVENGCGQSGHGTLKFNYISRINEWIAVTFCMLVQIQESLELFD